MSEIAIVILNWNTADYLRRFLPSVLESAGYVHADSGWTVPEEGCIAEVIVADSHSSDNSLEVMQTVFPAIRTIPLDDNYGFTGGYNRAFDRLQGQYKYYILLNSDIEVSRGWIEPLKAFLDTHPEYGACAPKLHSWYEKDKFEYAGAAGGYIDFLGYPFCRGRIMKTLETDNGQYGDADVFWATGACLMIRSEVFHGLGGLDNRFFAHMEEIDLCWRMQLKGLKIRVITDSVIWHLGGGTLPNDSPWKLKLNYRNNLLMLSNNLAMTYAATMPSVKAIRKANSLILCRMLLDGASAAIYLLTGRPKGFKAVFQAHKEYKAQMKTVSRAEVEAYKSICPKALTTIYPASMILDSHMRPKALKAFFARNAKRCEPST